jgi:uncharacterized protein (TIGR02246 family)
MKRAAVFALLAITIACAQAPATNDSGDVSAVNALRGKFMQVFNAGDAAAVGNLYTTDAIAMDNHQPTATGREAIVAAMTGLFSQYAVKFTLTPDETKTMGDFGYDLGRFTFALTPKTAGAPAPPTDEGRYLVLLRKDTDGQWRVTRDIGNSTLPMPMPMTMMMEMPTPTPPAKKGGK